MIQAPEDLMLRVDLDVEINASPQAVFASLLHQLGPGNLTSDENSLALKLEPWPGGRWFRDLKDNNGHFWGHVQVIKRPTLLEITGPMCMSYPALSHVQFRITPKGDKSLLTLRHQALGRIQDDHRAGFSTGWNDMLTGVKRHAEGQ